MEIRSLNNTPLKQLVDCFLISFSDYFVKLPEELDYWENRWKLARVNYNLSFGMFDKKNLVGFIINGIDELDGNLVAFNTGTGVIPTYRGRKIIQQIYEFAFPELIKNGISICKLEVITENKRAINVYEQIGFKKTKTLCCFKGEIMSSGNVILNEKRFNDINWELIPNQNKYSWDNSIKALKMGKENYKFYEVIEGDLLIGFFAINPDIGYIAQLEVFNDKESNWEKLCDGVSQIATTIKINNIKKNQLNKINTLKKIGLENYIDQYEMEMKIGAT